MRESSYQASLIDKLERRFPGIEILKNDSGLRQGIPDLTLFYNDRWAMLEVKASAASAHQPNQDYYVERFNQMSYATFIFPENEEEVLDGLQQTLAPGRKARSSER